MFFRFCFRFRKTVCFMVQFLSPTVESTVLSVFAHPDDAELSCFGLLAKLRESGWKIVIAIATRGENGADSQAWNRESEARASAALIGAEVVFGDFRDGSVPRSSDLIGWVDSLLETWRPALIVTHFAAEARLAHQDHVAVEAAVHIATRRAAWLPDLLLAEGVDAEPSFRPNWFADVTAQFDCKLRALAMHESQAGKPYMRACFTRLRARRWELQFPSNDLSETAPRYWEAFVSARHVI